MTIAVAMPATTTAPNGPARTIRSSLACSVSVDEAESWETIMASSLQWRGTERVGLACGNRGAVVAPGDPDVGHDRRDFVVGERLGEWRHSVRHRIADRPRRIAAIEDHPHRIYSRGHLDRLIGRKRRIVRRLAQSLVAVATGALVGIDGLPEPQQQAAFLGRCRGTRRVGDRVLGEALE